MNQFFEFQTSFKLFVPLYRFILLRLMNWLKANRLSAKDPLNISVNDTLIRSSVDTKIRSTKGSESESPQKIKSNPSFSLQKINAQTIPSGPYNKSTVIKRKDEFKLPSLKKVSISDCNPQQDKIIENPKEIFYQSQVYKALTSLESTYIVTLARQHFYQTIEALRLTRNIKLAAPKKQIKLQKKSTHKKTIYLDLDQTLIHTDELSNSYTVKLAFPIQNGSTIQAGVRIRPFCRQFLQQLAKIAEIIIFTASSSAYADVILDYLDPEKKLFSHRLYRNHCTLQRSYFIKDLRVVNRKLEDVAIVDNSAFSFLLQPQNGIPIIPYYHFAKDQELPKLLQYLKQLVTFEDLRESIRKTFYLQTYINNQNDPKKMFVRRHRKEIEPKTVSGM